MTGQFISEFARLSKPKGVGWAKGVNSVCVWTWHGSLELWSRKFFGPWGINYTPVLLGGGGMEFWARKIPSRYAGDGLQGFIEGRVKLGKGMEPERPDPGIEVNTDDEAGDT